MTFIVTIFNLADTFIFAVPSMIGKERTLKLIVHLSV